MTKPSVFIGSSAEGLEPARAIRSLLFHDAKIILWNEGFFKPGYGFLETLVNNLSSFDFAILVATPDDFVRSRNVKSLSPRDNVIFELGLFTGYLDRSRTFLVHSPDAKLKIPTDFAGVTTATYEWPYDKQQETALTNLRQEYMAALGETCDSIRNAIQSLGFHETKTNRQLIDVKKDVQEQEQKFLKQQEIINQLVIFSMSQPIYEKLLHLYFCKRNGTGEYIYQAEHEEASRREFLFLRDNGYLASAVGGFFDPGPHLIGQDLVPLIELTPIGNFYVEQREELRRRLDPEDSSAG